VRIDDIQAKRYLHIGHLCLQRVYSDNVLRWNPLAWQEARAWRRAQRQR
jgi:hypothetical protein